MKRTEIATIILVFSISCVAAYFGTNALIGKNIKHEAQVEQTKLIVDDVKDFSPSKRIFNDNAINPTVEVFVQNQGEGGVSTMSDSTTSSSDSSTGTASTTGTTSSDGQQNTGAASSSPTNTVNSSTSTTNKSEK